MTLITRKEYLKQLHMQNYYLNKFCINYASTWLKKDVLQLINAINNEIDIYQKEIEKQNEKYKQQKLDL